jgi:signal peptidase I
MAKPKKPPRRSRDVVPKLPGQTEAKPAQRQPPSHATRETIESIVIAFVLAFLFRTFEAEAFVIPTGSMAPTLMGRHKDVVCPKCGYRFEVGASEEESDDVLQRRAQLSQFGSNPQTRARLTGEISGYDVVGGMCPMCHHVMPMVPDLPPDVPESQDAGHITDQRSYNGDRILVNKYIYSIDDPRRWDVVVFKFPGDAEENYIKRLVGLPHEVIRIYQGDLFVGADGASEDAEFKIARKPPDKLLAMRQSVHDTNHDPTDLYRAGWPLRWQAEASDDADPEGWKADTQTEGEVLRERYTIDRTGGDVAWLRYRHLVPPYSAWQRVADIERQGGDLASVQLASSPDGPQPQLITDYNMYNGRITRREIALSHGLAVPPLRTGIHWVGDLMVEADVDVKSKSGELLLDLVEGGKHFTCRVDLADGRAQLSVDGAEVASAAKTPLSAPGHYRVAFANFDDGLLLWVDGKLVSFEGDGKYDVDQVFGGRGRIRPYTSQTDPGDLAPVGIGVSNAAVDVTRLQVWRDIYYIADRWDRGRGNTVVTDYQYVPDQMLGQVARDPSMWNAFLERREVQFPLGENQLFVMGDNSAESSDARLWKAGAARGGGIPGGAYLEERLLTGKALCVYWPHSWNRIPGTAIPFPLFPNFADMRLVR